MREGQIAKFRSQQYVPSYKNLGTCACHNYLLMVLPVFYRLKSETINEKQVQVKVKHHGIFTWKGRRHSSGKSYSQGLQLPKAVEFHHGIKHLFSVLKFILDTAA